MKRMAMLTGAVLAGATALPSAAAATTTSATTPSTRSAAAVVCGNHWTQVGESTFHRQFLWGNCSDQAVRVNVWSAAYSGGGPFEHFVRQVCAPAQQDTVVGESTNYVVLRYYVKDTAGPC